MENERFEGRTGGIRRMTLLHESTFSLIGILSLHWDFVLTLPMCTLLHRHYDKQVCNGG